MLDTGTGSQPHGLSGSRRRLGRRFAGASATACAVVVVWAVLLAPDQAAPLRPFALAALPVEGLIFVVMVVILPDKGARFVAATYAVALPLVAILKVLDVGSDAVLARPFDPLTDLPYLPSAADAVSRSTGAPLLLVLAASAVALTVLVLLVIVSTIRVARAARRHRRRAALAAVAAGAAWALLAGVGAAPGPPTAAAAGTANLVARRAVRLAREWSADRKFAAATGSDSYARTAGGDLLAGLRGKDVLIVFVESYGRVALDDPDIARHVVPALDAAASPLGAAGFQARSAFLTSPTFGGLSWLAHSTLQSGLWVDTQTRYDALLASKRLTLGQAFGRAGWRTVCVIPSDTRPWTPGTAFYHWGTIYDARNLGYVGPRYGYARIPDQYTLAQLQRLELSRKDRPPVMAEVDLASSHAPWASPPDLVAWDAVGNGSIFERGPAAAPTPRAIPAGASGVGDGGGDMESGSTTSNTQTVGPDIRTAYARTIAYSLQALYSFVGTYRDDNLVLVVLGDHQPGPSVSGSGAGHDVPITIVSADPKVMRRMDSWGWDVGLRPGAGAPVWPMDSFRDRFLTAYASSTG